MLREAACLHLAERLFQSFAPLNEKHFLPFSVPFFGNLRSVYVRLNDYTSSFEELLHRNEEVAIHDKKTSKAYARGIQMYDLREPILSVGVLQQKSASI